MPDLDPNQPIQPPATAPDTTTPVQGGRQATPTTGKGQLAETGGSAPAGAGGQPAAGSGPTLPPPADTSQDGATWSLTQSTQDIEDKGIDIAAIEDLLIKNNLQSFKHSEQSATAQLDAQIADLQKAAQDTKQQAGEELGKALLGIAITVGMIAVGVALAATGVGEVAADAALMEVDAEVDVGVDAGVSEGMSEGMSEGTTQAADTAGADGDETTTLESDDIGDGDEQTTTSSAESEDVDDADEDPQEKAEDETQKEEEDLDKEKARETKEKAKAQQKARILRGKQALKATAAKVIGAQALFTGAQYANNDLWQQAIDNTQSKMQSAQATAAKEGDVEQKQVQYAQESEQSAQAAIQVMQQVQQSQDQAYAKIFS